MKILVVDDSAIMRRVIGKVANQLGFKTVEADQGAECLAQLRKHADDIGLVVLDWNMPVMDGLEVLKRVRSTSEYDHIQVLMATADGVEEDVISAIEAGANSYLVKPFTEESLSARICELLPNDVSINR